MKKKYRDTLEISLYSSWSISAIPPASNSDSALKSLIHWSPTNYLNMYESTLCCGTLGYATFPSDLFVDPQLDGVVIDYKFFGNTSHPKYGNGRTATHEVGHWLGLLHTFTTSCNTDDGINDTPVCDDPFFSHYSNNCPSVHKCTFQNNSLGITDRRQIENYMDYSDDLCMDMFTEGQSDVMRANLNTTRSAISDTIFTSSTAAEFPCNVTSHCENDIQNADETGVDCDGQDCKPCNIGGNTLGNTSGGYYSGSDPYWNCTSLFNSHTFTNKTYQGGNYKREKVKISIIF